MPGTAPREKVDDPCRECRDRHLKCDNDRPRCQQCTRMNHACQRSTGAVKFKSGSSKKWDDKFGKNQTWLARTRHAKVQFHDEGPDLKNEYSVEDPDEPAVTVRQLPSETVHRQPSSSARSPSATTSRSNSWVSTPTDTVRERTASLASRAVASPPSIPESPLPLSPLKRPHPDDNYPRPYDGLRLPPIQVRDHPSSNVIQNGPLPDMRNVYTVFSPSERDSSGQYGPDMYEPLPRQIEAEYQRLEDDQAAAIPEEDLLSPEQWKRYFRWPNSKTTNLCECLMRYFTEELAPWFDVGDPSRTFATVVPYKACFNPPLLNAVFTAASRHLLYSKRYRNAAGVIQYQGISLPRLTEDTCYKYLGAVIAYLKRAFNADHLCDVENLAAAVLLRFAGDFQKSITGIEEDQVTKTYQSFVRARTYEMSRKNPSSPPNHGDWLQSSHTPHPNQAVVNHIPKEDRQSAKATLLTFEHACNRIALRQEVLATITYVSRKEGRATINADFELPPTWNALRVFPPQGGIEDFIWTDMHLRHLAEVLRLHTDRADATSQVERYDILRKYQMDWEQHKPYSFAPYHKETPGGHHHQQLPHPHHPSYPQHTNHFTLPATWLLTETNLIGNQYISLARICLAEANPSHLPPPRSTRARTISEIRDTVLHICGMANNTSRSIFAKEVAYAAITFSVPQFQSPYEQNELLGVVQGMERDFGWPVDSRIVALLRDYQRYGEAEEIERQQQGALARASAGGSGGAGGIGGVMTARNMPPLPPLPPPSSSVT